MSVASRVYLAGKIDMGEISIGDFAGELEERGHTVLEKWWEQGRLPKPYMDHPETSAPAAEAMIEAAFESDIMILFPEDNILGAAVEYGAAIASSFEERPRKEIIVVNPYEVRQSVFYAHPSVVAVRGLAEVRQRPWF
jgi:hypothetical protein